jgi:pimeloyl-ACP methyl ester carboxylesterase
MRAIVAISLLSMGWGCIGCGGGGPSGGASVTRANASEPESVRAQRSAQLAPAPDAPQTLDHFVQVAPGRVIHVIETFTLRSREQCPHRAIVMLPGPVTNGVYFNIDAPGYDGGAILAQQGYFSFAVDFEGSGQSSFPAQGRDATFARDLEDSRAVVEYVRDARKTRRVDVLGESWGGGIAAELCADPHTTRSCVMSSMLYRNVTAAGEAAFRSPAFHAFLESLTDGYIPLPAPFFGQFVTNSPPAVQAFTFAEEPGNYSVAPLYAAFDLPFFDPTTARVPGIVIQGDSDPNVPASDTQQLGADYGEHGAPVVFIHAGHVPRLEVPPANEIYWSTVVDFLIRRDRDEDAREGCDEGQEDR